VTAERDRLDELRDELDIEAQAFERARAAAGPVTGRDASGTVAVELDAEGVVQGVQVDSGWRHLLGLGELSAAVLSAYTGAVEARTELFVTTVADDEPPAPVRPAGHEQREVSADLVDRLRAADLPQGVLQGMSELLDDLSRSTDTAFGLLDDQLASTATGRSSSGHVRAEVSGGGELVLVDMEEKWLRTAHSFNVGRETTEAIHAALREQATRSVAAITQESGLGRLQQLTADPQALARLLGLDQPT
jgi:DNA-binding protein YbaB